MADGTTKASEVHDGDVVMATDPQTGETRPETVTATITTPDDKDFTDLTLTDDANPRGPPAADQAKITSTHHHPYWSETRNQWVDAGDLTPGEQLRQPDGTTRTIKSVRNYAYATTTHNLTVNLLHTYYVLAGQTPVLVHNCESLNLGSGDNPMSGAVNVDLKENPGVDVVANAGALPFRDGSFTSVHSINPYGFQPVSAETARVMRPGGILMVTGAKSNKWRKASADAIQEAGFELVSVGELAPEHAFGVMRRADGGEIPAGARFETRIYRRL
ncbi:polymorphic toxin-type HINT domain-containing protein [Kitasatospora sp. NPDC098652]|uniref:polymorphic toxin-type HINT domain-containing protein n=1 Tax=Kitasatospora sp. NPDC098652 TaxID=3364095 RepID=UPI0037F4B357